MSKTKKADKTPKVEIIFDKNVLTEEQVSTQIKFVISQLREARKARGISSLQVAADLGVSATTVTKDELGYNPSIGLAKLIRYASYYGINPVILCLPLNSSEDVYGKRMFNIKTLAYGELNARASNMMQALTVFTPDFINSIISITEIEEGEPRIICPT